MKTATSRAGRRGSAGFTLIELLVVLSLMALIAVLAMPRYHLLLPGLEARAAARLAADALKEARGRAIRDGRETLVLFDLAGRRLKIAEDEWQALGGSGEDYRLALEFARRETEDPSLGAIRFYPDGSSTGGRLAIASAEEERTIVVDWLTGRVFQEAP